jgi:ferredoxin
MVPAGELDPGPLQHVLADQWDQDQPRSGWNVVVVAVPRPAHRVVSALGQTGRAKALLPPTCFRCMASFEDIRQDLAANGLPLARVEHLGGPHKAIAARLGLARYGRNNLVYAPGIGSCLQLGVFSTDAKLPRRPASDRPALLQDCAGCDRCRKACPTGAIGKDSGLSFSPIETKALLEAGENLPPAVRNSLRIKLARLGRSHMETLLGRNLAALVRTLRPARYAEVRA